MIGPITPDAILGKKVSKIVSVREVGSDGFVNGRCLIQMDEAWLELDSRGVDGPTDLYWSSVSEEYCTVVFPDLVGREVTHVVVSDYLPTFALILSDEEILYCSDLGPPFNAFGPLHQQLGAEYSKSDMLDFWKRTAIASDS